MANSLNVQIVEDGRRNAVVKLVGVVDTNDLVYTPVIARAQFVDNDGILLGFKVVEVEYTGTPGLLVLLDWNANAPQNICALSTSANLNAKRHGGFDPDKLAGGFDGNINLNTRGFTPGSVYGFTATLRMVKMY